MGPRRLLLAIGAIALAILVPLTANAAPPAPDESSSEYVVTGARGVDKRAAITRTGAVVRWVDHGEVTITATPEQVAQIRRLGYGVRPANRATAEESQAVINDFPPEDANYHNYTEMVNAINQIVAAHPSIARKSSYGASHQNRDLVLVKISDNVGTDEAEPEVLFTHHQHAREHLTVEMALYLINELTSKYATDTRIKTLVDSREIWIMPDVNPDGGEFDIATGVYQHWRKNRQPNAGSTAIGTDTNRNWAHKWGCCNGSSGSPSSEQYRGAAPESAPEVKAMADWVRSRAVGGTQQIRTHIDFHTFGELVLWPYGYTYADTDPADGMTATDAAAFRALGRAMATTNGYTPMQASDLYKTDGGIDDWMWGNQRIFSFTFEMFPPDDPSSPGFYPPDEAIPAQTSRNRAAVLCLLDYSDDPYRATGRDCGPTAPPPPPGYFENPNNMNIPDAPGAAIESPITVTGVPGNAPTALQVGVDIKHTWRGDVVIDLVAPDGSLYRLKNSNQFDGFDNVITTYTVNASTEAANGLWKLRVRDAYSSDTGFIDKWSLQF